MAKAIQVIDRLTILCGECFKVLGRGFTYGHVFYCDECLAAIKAKKNVQELDND